MSTVRLALNILRELAVTWAFAGFVPLPLLLATDPVRNAEISCFYRGVASAWLATEVFRLGGLPESRSSWCAKMHETVK
jgi:hypothetical protein